MVKDIFIEENINKRKRNVVQMANNSITLFDTYWILGLWKLVGRKKRSILIKIAQNRRQKVKSLHSEAVTQKCSVKKCVLEISQNLQENACARASFLIKLHLAQVFLVNFVKFLRTLYLQNTSGSCFGTL